MKRFPFFFLCTACMIMYGCGEQQPQGRVVARVNDQVLTLEMIRAQSDTSRKPSDEEMKQFVNRWVTNELLFQEARQKGYDASEQIRQKVAEAHKQLSIAELLENEVYALAEKSITSDEVTSYYQTHPGEFTANEDLIRLTVAVFNRNDVATQFRAIALGPQGWVEAVAAFRSDLTKGMISYADSLFYSQSTLYPAELWKVAAILGYHEVSFPVKTSAGFFVIRQLGQYKKGTTVPLSYVEEEIRQRLAMERRQERYQEFIQQLRNKHTVQFMFSQTDSTAFGGE
ncbi:MAG: peptidyl-prolyl cis-trans isomerase [Ignavibacteriales bacterium]|nr:peptidyl-prolyl cis-trans isomerase [Ignavibacteriales bacterium]